MAYGTATKTLVYDPGAPALTSNIIGWVVKLDSGEEVEAKISSANLAKINEGLRVSVTPIDDVYFIWEIVSIEPVEMPIPISHGFDGTSTLDIDIDGMTFANDAVWVLGEDGEGSKKLQQLSAQDGTVVKSLTIVEEKKGVFGQVFFEEGSLWVHVYDTLYVIDTTIPAISKTWTVKGYVLGVHNDVVWYTNTVPDTGLYELSRYDLAERTIIGANQEKFMADILFDDQQAWILTSGIITQTIPNSDQQQSFLANGLAKLDTDTGAVGELLAYYYGDKVDAFRMVPAIDSIWLALNDGSLVEMDRASGEYMGKYGVVFYEDAYGKSNNKKLALSGIDFDGIALWVGHPASGSVLRFDPTTRYVTDVFSSTGQVTYPKVGGGRVWVIDGSRSISWVDIRDAE